MNETVYSFRSQLEGLMQRLRRLANSVALSDSNIHWEYDAYHNEFFPFRAYASAVRGAGVEAEEVLIISVQCHRPGGEGEKLVLYADMSREDGSVLAESPVQEIALSPREPESPSGIPRHDVGRDSDAQLDLRIGEAITALDTWLERQVPLIEKELSPSGAGDRALP
jgi:hypothetical protein